jgi:hypothetical protein
VLILCPTRELAVQVCEEVHRLGAKCRPACDPGLRRRADGPPAPRPARWRQVVVGTPGRLLDHLRRGSFDASHVKMAILDEADRMLDMGFKDEMDELLAALPAERQTLFFSATMNPGVSRLIRSFGKEPGNRRNPAEGAHRLHRRTIVFRSPPTLEGRGAVAHPRHEPAAPRHHFLQHQTLGGRMHRGSDQPRIRRRPPPRRHDPDDARAGAETLPRGQRSNCWSPPTSPPAASTSMRSTSSSTTTCRPTPRTTSTASAAPAAPGARAAR